MSNHPLFFLSFHVMPPFLSITLSYVPVCLVPRVSFAVIFPLPSLHSSLPVSLPSNHSTIAYLLCHLYPAPCFSESFRYFLFETLSYLLSHHHFFYLVSNNEPLTVIYFTNIAVIFPSFRLIFN